MALFVFTAQQLTNVLREQIKKGINIRLIVDPAFASRTFSEVLNLLKDSLSDHTCNAEEGIQQWIKHSKASAPPASRAAINFTTSSP